MSQKFSQDRMSEQVKKKHRAKERKKVAEKQVLKKEKTTREKKTLWNICLLSTNCGPCLPDTNLI
jgi:hypothetical protein